MRKHASDYIFTLAKAGLVVIEVEGEPDTFMIVRPACLPGTPFFETTHLVGTGSTTVLTDAPSATLRQVGGRRKKWEVDISAAAAPGPGSVWFHEKFVDPEEAVKAIHDCYFADRVDFQSEALPPHYRRARTQLRDPCGSEFDSEKAVRLARGILEGSTPVFIGCQYLYRALIGLGVSGETPFVTITEIDSALREMPISLAERKLWHAQAVARQDAKLAEWLPQIEPTVFEVCREVIQRFGKRV